jgi:hypothetical protein
MNNQLNVVITGASFGLGRAIAIAIVVNGRAGSRYFCESFFGHPCPNKRQKLRKR